MDAVSRLSGFSRRNVEDYTSLQEILAEIEATTRENFLQTQANEVMERYLRKKNPNLLIGFDKTVMDHPMFRDSLVTRSLSTTVSRDSSSLTLTRTSTGSSPVLTSRSALHSSMASNRLNIIYRIEMVEREVEEGKMTMDKLIRRFECAKFILQTEEEKFRSQLETLQDSKKNFGSFVTDSTDKKTGRVFQDKFIRYLESELQLKDRELRKMKLKTKTYQTEYNRMKSQQQQKLELREQLHPVDLDKLHIENQQLLQVLDSKTRHLLDLKRSVGRKGQNLVSLKSKLNDTILFLKNISQDIKQKEFKYTFTETKEAQNLNNLVSAELLNQSIKKLNSTVKSPDVHSYLKMDMSLNELRMDKQVWERRCRNQRQNIILLEHQVKQIAQSSSRSTFRTTRSVFSSKSADSTLKQRDKINYPHATPATPMLL
uniref:Cilia- and flagella-associated protein 263 n=1 Tax=Graphocephala atropunctata TaxID=36148 RepID=A0A1B6LMP6_9HEMI